MSLRSLKIRLFSRLKKIRFPETQNGDLIVFINGDFYDEDFFAPIFACSNVWYYH